jgi:hypothetical protein
LQEKHFILILQEKHFILIFQQNRISYFDLFSRSKFVHYLLFLEIYLIYGSSIPPFENGLHLKILQKPFSHHLKKPYLCIAFFVYSEQLG